MRKTLVWAVLLVPALWASPARAADPALVANFSRDLRSDDPGHWDEKALLAAVLTRPQESAAFDADARAALSDPQLRKLFTAKWRGKLAAFAATEMNIPDVDLTRTYRPPSWSAIMSTEQKAYTAQRMKSMTEANRTKLNYYLNKLNENLAASGGKIESLPFSISAKIVAGIMDEYKADLSAYVATPVAQAARRDAAAAAQALAAALAKQPSAAPAVVKAPLAPPDPKSAAAKVPLAPPARAPALPAPPMRIHPEPEERTTAVAPTGGALEQARRAAEAGPNAGQVFDGGARAGAPTSAGAVVAPPNGLTARPTLTASQPGPRLDANGPPSPDLGNPGDDDYVRQIQSMGTGAKPWVAYTPVLSAAGGALLGGILGAVVGFLFGGPVGAAIGAAVGAAAIGGGMYLGLKNVF